MPCGKRPLVKNWDRPRNIRVAKPSRYQQNEASVKVHWKNVTRELELFYQDVQFWESQSKTVRELVGPIIYERLAKIFGLQLLEKPYVPQSETSTITASEQYYIQPSQQGRSTLMKSSYSLSEFAPEEIQEEGEEEEEATTEDWSAITTPSIDRISRKRSTRSVQSIVKEKSTISTKSLAASLSKINMSKMLMSKTFNRSFQRSFSNKFIDRFSESSSEISAQSNDDIEVHAKSHAAHKKTLRLKSGIIYNPHFELLYCNESESDMIKWESKYKKKTLEVSASDEYSKKAELLTKQICQDFYVWWLSVGSADYKSEIKCPEDLESLFQIWFDEHASRGLVLDPKIMPCVLKSIANYVGVPRAACPNALKRQIAWDIEKESSPAHTRAFNSSLPREAKHIPPQNRTAETWQPVKVPEDLKSMTAVWGDVSHLTSTKAFTKWLQQHPYLPMPPCLKELGQPGEKKQLFVVPSDFVVREGSEDFSEHDLNIPVSQFSLEIKEVLSRLLHD